MTLEENIKAILECNFVIARDEVIESTTKRIMEQIERQNPLEKIKEEMDNKGWYNRHDKEQFAEIIDKHIAELKGDKCDNNHDCEHCDWVECPLDKEN